MRDFNYMHGSKHNMYRINILINVYKINFFLFEVISEPHKIKVGWYKDKCSIHGGIPVLWQDLQAKIYNDLLMKNSSQAVFKVKLAAISKVKKFVEMCPELNGTTQFYSMFI